MTVAVLRSTKARHLVLRASAGDAFPVALREALDDERVKHGWIRATGVLDDAEIRPLAGPAAGLSRAIAGPLHLLHLDAPIPPKSGTEGSGWRALVAFDGEAGPETLAVEILRARIRTLEAVVTVLDDLAASNTWSAAIDAAARPEPVASGTAPGAKGAGATAMTGGAPMPTRPVRPAAVDVETLVPEVGDFVQHFAFGPGEVIKSEGDRLHVRAHKDGRIREIALEMLRVTPLDGAPAGAPGTRQFKLERRI